MAPRKIKYPRTRSKPREDNSEFEKKGEGIHGEEMPEKIMKTSEVRRVPQTGEKY